MASPSKLQSLKSIQQKYELQIADLEKLRDDCYRQLKAEGDFDKRRQLNARIDNYVAEISQVFDNLDNVNQEINKIQSPSPPLSLNNGQDNPNNQPQLNTFSFETFKVNRWGKVIKIENHTASSFTETLANKVDLEMVAIPGGTFMMGSSENEKGSNDNERPQHQVTISPFFMGKYPVTQAQWKAIALLTDLKVNEDLDPDPSYFKGDNRPVECVNWDQAVEFCLRLCRLTGKEYRLPSEAEWEYACRADPPKSPLKSGTSDSPPFEGGVRGGSYPPFHFGETITTDLANYDGNYTYADEQKGVYRGETTPVGMFPANAFGLYDLHGNVWEWCADDWHHNYKNAPSDGSAWITEDNNFVVLRGGSFDGYPSYCRSASRSGSSARDLDDRRIGFRVVCVLPKYS